MKNSRADFRLAAIALSLFATLWPVWAEPGESGTEPTNRDRRELDPEADYDGDGVRNAFDRCDNGSDREDRDEDGVPDACDVCPDGLDADMDSDEVPDGCDNCPNRTNSMVPRPEGDLLFEDGCRCRGFPPPKCCWQADSDGDGRGDECAPGAPIQQMRIKSTVNRAGEEQDSYEYNGDLLVRLIKWNAQRRVMMTTEFHHDRHGRVMRSVETPTDGSAAPRTDKYFYDSKGRLIGKMSDDLAMSGAKFQYVNDRGELYLRTTIADPPETATILDYFVYDSKDRLVEQWSRLPHHERLVQVGNWTYVDKEDRTYEVTTRDRVDELSESVRQEGFDRTRRRTFLREYPTLVSPRGGPLPTDGLLTTFDYHRRMDDSGNVVAEEWVTVQPSGVRETRKWQIEGRANQAGSQRIEEEFVSPIDNPSDAEKQRWSRRISPFSEGYGYLSSAIEQTPSGDRIEFVRDPQNPAIILKEILNSKGEGGVPKRTETSYQYDPAGRVVVQTTCCEGRTRSSWFEYDYRGRTIKVRTVDGTQSATWECRYDAFDRVQAERNGGPDVVRVVRYGPGGRRILDGLARHSGPLADLEELTDADYIERTRFDYHPVSGRLAIAETIRPGSPSETGVAPSVESYEVAFDETGQWPLDVLRGDNQGTRSTLYEYDDQGRVVLTVDEGGTERWTELDGRGHPVQSIESVGGEDRTTTLRFNALGELELVEFADGTIEVYEYDEVGRLIARKTFKSKDDSEPSRVVRSERE